MIEGDVDVPVVGSVDKKVLIGVGGLAAAFVGWRYWQSRQAASYDPEAVDPGFEDGGLLPGVAGAVRPGNDYGLDDDEDESTDSYGFRGKTNSEWTQYASTQLARSDTWTYTQVVSALGNFVTDRPLSTEQQQIVQAAIGLAGYPPVGNHVIIPGGNTEIMIAPSGLTATPGPDRITVNWSAVPGAASYYLYRNDQGGPTVVPSGTTAIMYNLDPGREYKLSVAAVSGSGKVGPISGQKVVKTTAPTLRAPTGLRVVQISRTSVLLGYTGVAGARGYRAYRSGLKEPIGTATGTRMQIGGLRPATTYSITIKGETGAGEGVGPGASIRITTKK